MAMAIMQVLAQMRVENNISNLYVYAEAHGMSRTDRDVSVFR
jgi:hypothetical protein